MHYTIVNPCSHTHPAVACLSLIHRQFYGSLQWNLAATARIEEKSDKNTSQRTQVLNCKYSWANKGSHKSEKESCKYIGFINKSTPPERPLRPPSRVLEKHFLLFPSPGSRATTKAQKRCPEQKGSLTVKTAQG